MGDLKGNDTNTLKFSNERVDVHGIASIKQIHAMLHSYYRVVSSAASLSALSLASACSLAIRARYAAVLPVLSNHQLPHVTAYKRHGTSLGSAEEAPEQRLCLTFGSAGFPDANCDLRSICSGIKSYLERSRGFNRTYEHASAEFDHVAHFGDLDGRCVRPTL